MFNFTAQDLRRSATVSEQILWNYLRARRMVGLKFRRQHPMGPFIVDFVCLKERVIIELDGLVHEGRESYDRNRDRWLKSQGYTIMRIKNEEIEKDWENVLRKIRGYLLKKLGF